MKKTALAILLVAIFLCAPVVLAMESDPAVQTDEVTASLLSGASIETDAEYDGYLVGVKQGGLKSASADDNDLEEVIDGVYHADSVEEITEVLSTRQIEYIEPDYTITLEGTDDPLSDNQWHLAYTSASAAWARGLTGEGVRLAVIDSGLRVSHEDLNAANILPGWNYLDGNADVTDNVGHGTMVTGIVAAVRDNGLGVAGLADGVEIVPLKAFRDDGSGSTKAVAAAMRAAVDDYGCQVINMSFSNPEYSRTLKREVDYAAENGVIMIAAAGNKGDERLSYPAAFDEVIGVGAISESGTRASFSQYNESVFVSAPGERIRTLSSSKDNGYTSGSGTSFSTPIVAAAAALAKSYDPDMTDAQFRQLLIDTSIDLGDPGYDPEFGYGALCLDSMSAQLTGVELPQAHPADRMVDIDGHWAVDSIYWAVENGLVVGVSENEFGPERDMTRAMFVTILGRMVESQGGVIPDIDAGFTDLEAGAYYQRYVGWAQQSGIIQGHGDGTFGPDDKITREQAAHVMHNYAKYSGVADSVDLSAATQTITQYSDSGDIESWAVDSVEWALRSGIIRGETEDRFSPGQLVVRAEVVWILHQYALTF